MKAETHSKSVGFVYVLTNRAMPRYVKVGMSSRLSEDRAQELSTTGVPETFEVFFRMATSFPRRVEQEAHALLSEYRKNPRREFFVVEPDRAVAAIRTAALATAGLDAEEWSNKVRTVRTGDRIALTLRAGQLFIVLPKREPPSLRTTERVPIDYWEVHSDGDLLELMGTKDPQRISGFGTGDDAGHEDPVPYLNREGTAANGNLNGKERLSPGQSLLWLEQQEADQYGRSPVKFTVFQMATYCQVTCRTWTPCFTPEGYPLILNTPMHDLTPVMISVTRAALNFPAFELETAEVSERIDHKVEFGSLPSEPEHWLLQLQRRSGTGRGL